ncbi:unnamed protein product [marine sediment metagenome]|uniref:Uncharacterized protein n=1 Tax=marine sediment metagenome TaxID=412755 RepID=X1BJ19_9ZZZZ
MSEFLFLKRFFQAYYQKMEEKLPQVSFLEQREFGFIPWEKPIMIRHMGFNQLEILSKYFKEVFNKNS